MPKKRKRRARGTGYVSYDPRRESWRIVVPHPDGTATTHYRAAASRAEAEAWLDAERSRLVSPPIPTLAEAAAEWLESRSYTRDTTQTNYILHARRIAETLGSSPLTAITPAAVAKMDSAHRRGEYALTAAVADQILATGRSIYRRAMALYPGVVVTNPFESYSVLTPSRARGGAALREPVALDPGVCRLILREMADDPYGPFVAWLLVLGVRSGELRGLRWANVRAGTVAIVEQRIYTDRFTPRPIKTEAVIGKGRTLPLPAALLAMTPVIGNDLVFPNAQDSGSISQNTLRVHLNNATDRLRLPRIHVHDCRHTCGGGLRDLGCPYIDEILGHTPPTQTAHYARARVEALRPWVERWAGMVIGESAERARLGA